jgi:hypothetical protein
MRRWLLLFTLLLPLCAQQPEQQTNYQPNWPCNGKERAFDPVYLSTAEASGGQMFLFDPSEVDGFSVIAINSRKHPATVARSVGKLENYLDVSVPVDASIESLYISVTLQCKQRIVIYDPQNSEALPQQTGGEDHLYHAGRIATIPHPAPGTWTVRLLGSGAYSLVVQAKTSIILNGLNFDGGLPHSGTPQNASVFVRAPTAALHFRMVNEAGETLQPLDLEPSAQDASHYTGMVTLGTQRFRLLVEGTDAQGFPFQRLDPRLFDPTLRALRQN